MKRLIQTTQSTNLLVLILKNTLIRRVIPIHYFIKNNSVRTFNLYKYFIHYKSQEDIYLSFSFLYNFNK